MAVESPILAPARPCPLWYWVPQESADWTPPGTDKPARCPAVKLPSDGSIGVGLSRLPGTMSISPTWNGDNLHPVGDGRLLVVNGLRPEHVQRERQVDGHPVELGDGNTWTIPVASMLTGNCRLPRRRTLGDGNGTGKGWKIDPAYEELCEMADQVFRARLGEDVPDMDDDFLDCLFTAALAVNYDLTEDEAIAAGLLTDQALRDVVDALLDWQTVEALVAAQAEAEKKTTGVPE